MDNPQLCSMTLAMVTGRCTADPGSVGMLTLWEFQAGMGESGWDSMMVAAFPRGS